MNPSTSRSYTSIVLANVFSTFNVVLAVFGVLTFAFGDAEDALFVGILITNAGFGILQEARAKRALDRLAALVAPSATVIRDGTARRLPLSEVVVGDLVRLEAGDRISADGRLRAAERLVIDESVLTGESQPVVTSAGHALHSGAFVLEGAGILEVTAVGPDSYAERVTGEARRFRHPLSPLERDMNRLLLLLVSVMLPLGAILGYSLWQRRPSLADAVTIAVAAIVPLVPEGLVLLTRLTYAIGALRMARRGVLAQQLSAIESLASTDVICVDKTGTLTERALHVTETIPAPGVAREALERACGRYAASARSRNMTLVAVATAWPAAAEPPTAEVPFSSHRRWSALRLGAEGFVLGAPELFPLGTLAEIADQRMRAGRRVLAIGTTSLGVDMLADTLPSSGLTVLGLIVLAERLRPDTREMVRQFSDAGVTLKVISGDAPETVAAIAVDAGIPCEAGALDGRTLPADLGALRTLALGASVIGRASPDDKRRLVESLRDAGLHVTMVGDGVNDVPALKAAQLAIAPGTGTEMAKAVADLVLIRGDFAAVPALLAEGRQALRNLQRVSKLFVTKSVFAAFVILTVGITPHAYPFLSRHLTLAAALTIGIPAFFLALAPSAGAWRHPGFLRDIGRFSIPAGTAAGLAVVSSFLFARDVLRLPLLEARSVSVTTLVLVGLYLVLVLEGNGRQWRRAWIVLLCLALFGIYVVVLALPFTRELFDVVPPTPIMALSALGAASLALAGLSLSSDRFMLRVQRRGHCAEGAPCSSDDLYGPDA